jgi:hypothetical protein
MHVPHEIISVVRQLLVPRGRSWVSSLAGQWLGRQMAKKNESASDGEEYCSAKPNTTRS